MLLLSYLIPYLQKLYWNQKYPLVCIISMFVYFIWSAMRYKNYNFYSILNNFKDGFKTII